MYQNHAKPDGSRPVHGFFGLKSHSGSEVRKILIHNINIKIETI